MMVIVEELNFKLRIEVEKPTARPTAENPSRTMIFNLLFSDLKVAGGGRSGSTVDQTPVMGLIQVWTVSSRIPDLNCL